MARRCAKCDTVIDSPLPDTNPPSVFGDSECTNPVCNPKKAEELAAKKAQDAADQAEFEEWKANRGK